MFCFDGEYRTKPKQSYGKASNRLQKSELIQRASAQRQDRESSRKQWRAIQILQAYSRGLLARKKQGILCRETFDQIKNRSQTETQILKDPQCLQSLFQHLMLLYNQSEDQQRLLWLSQIVIKNSKVIVNLLELSETTFQWPLRLSKFLCLNMKYLQSEATGPSKAVPLRVFEIITLEDNYSTNTAKSFLPKLWKYLISKGYFHQWEVIVKQLEPSFFTKTWVGMPLAESFVELLERPLRICTDSRDKQFVIKRLFEEVFISSSSKEVLQYLVPKLCQNRELFPPEQLLSAFTTFSTHSPWTMYILLKLLEPSLETLTLSQIYLLLNILKDHMCDLPAPQVVFQPKDDSDDEDEQMDHSEDTDSVDSIIYDCFELLNSPKMVNCCCRLIDEPNTLDVTPLFQICYFLHKQQAQAIIGNRLLFTLIFKPDFLRLLWSNIHTMQTSSFFGYSKLLLQCLAHGQPLSPADRKRFLPQMTMFCSFLSHLLPTLYDEEFFNSDTRIGSTMPFTPNELAHLSLSLRDMCLGLIELSFPETRPTLTSSYQTALGIEAIDPTEAECWRQLFKKSVALLHQLYARDLRKKFCPANHWIAQHFFIPIDRPTIVKYGSRTRRYYQPFVRIHHFTREQLLDEGPPMTSKEITHITILKELPFVVPFHHRVKIFRSLLNQDKIENQGDLENYYNRPQQATIRRSHIYEDAFDKLSLDNAPNFKARVQIHLINAVGVDEVGIDGGGILREFLNEVLKAALDPNRGFFIAAKDRFLYPNPSIDLVVADSQSHMYFIGRLLGKAIHESMLIDLPFAEFFLAKILQPSSEVDIHHLHSLDPILYKNLLSLKTFQGDVSELGLDFTVMLSAFGDNEIIELKPNGKNICVNNTNRIEYIHLVADFHLNRQIQKQCQAFKRGLASVIDLEWLRMFDAMELQIVMGGTNIPIDLEDLKNHTNYSGNKITYEHPYIVKFWLVVEGFTDIQKRQLLKFVTSCSRPPLLGFKELQPNFCIQIVGTETSRLPTASTCMNLLKLPVFQDEETLRNKLLYAIESGSGFELS